MHAVSDGRKLLKSAARCRLGDALARQKGRRVAEKNSAMSAEQHDQMLAIVSHLPHMLAFTLMNHIQTCTDFDPNYVLSYAGSSLRDCTRIAASSPEMWRDICLANRVQLLAELDKYQQALTELREQLANRNDEALLSLFKKASDLKLQWSNARDEKD